MYYLKVREVGVRTYNVSVILYCSVTSTYLPYDMQVPSTLKFKKFHMHHVFEQLDNRQLTSLLNLTIYDEISSEQREQS